MTRREQLHQKLSDTLGSENVYFQPPSTVKMQYPCIVYRRSRADEKRADDILYHGTTGYTVIAIDPNPDSKIRDRISLLPMCRFDRFYTSSNLNHDVFIIYY